MIGLELDGKFYVFKGFLARCSWIGTERGCQCPYNYLCEVGILVENGDGTRMTSEDQSFSSRSVNAESLEKAVDSGLTYGVWPDHQVSAAAEASDGVGSSIASECRY